MTYAARLHETCLGYESTSGNPCRCCCEGCLVNCGVHIADHGLCPVARRSWWTASIDSPWWKPIILDGIHGGDEWCNRTIGLRLPGGAVFIVINPRLRSESCEECLSP